MKYDDIPWHDSKEWKMGCWYPLPLSSTWCDNLTVVDGYGIFMLDKDNAPDIVPVGMHNMVFSEAVLICETHNEWKFDLGGRADGY